MKYYVFALRDSAANVYGVPFFNPSIGVAERNFRDAVNKPDDNNALYNHPSDFELFLIGEFDDVDASFKSEKPRQIARALDLVRPKGS